MKVTNNQFRMLLNKINDVKFTVRQGLQDRSVLPPSRRYDHLPSLPLKTLPEVDDFQTKLATIEETKNEFVSFL